MPLVLTMSDEEFEYEYDDDADYGSGNDAEEGGEDDVAIQIANAFYEADGAYSTAGVHLAFTLILC